MIIYTFNLSFCFFFFSSRRRHTRYWRDWSSDVCSSDLRTLHGRRSPLLHQGPPYVDHLLCVGSAEFLELSPFGFWELMSKPEDLGRSEEHTSELQSRQYLVCRLLLEKKKHKKTIVVQHHKR